MLTLEIVNGAPSIRERITMVHRSTKRIVTHLDSRYRHTTLTYDTYDHRIGEQAVIYGHDTRSRLVSARIAARLDGTYSVTIRVDLYNPLTRRYVTTFTERVDALDSLQSTLAWLDDRLTRLGLRKRTA